MKDYNIEYLRKRIGFIAEEPVLNKGSIISNIIYDIDSYDEDNQKDIFITYIYIFTNAKILFPNGFSTLVKERGMKVIEG